MLNPPPSPAAKENKKSARKGTAQRTGLGISPAHLFLDLSSKVIAETDRCPPAGPILVRELR